MTSVLTGLWGRKEHTVLPQYRYIKEGQLCILSAPSCYGQPKEGVEHGPQAILGNGDLVSKVECIKGPVEALWRCITQKDLSDSIEEQVGAIGQDEPIGKVKKPRSVGKVTELLHQASYEAASKGSFVLTLGGDHAIALGSISGMLKQYPDLVVIWVDAHADINTPKTTDTGNLHGCPVSFLLGLSGSDGLEGFEWRQGDPKMVTLSPSHLTYLGLRDVDGPERDLLKKQGIVAFTMQDIVALGVAKALERALRAVDPAGKRPIHLSFDIDALDPTVAPSTGTPVPGGLLEREGRYIVETLACTGRLVSMDLVEVNPSLGSEEHQVTTLCVARRLIQAALGETLL